MAADLDDDGEQTVSINEYLESIEEEELVKACSTVFICLGFCFAGMIEFNQGFSVSSNLLTCEYFFPRFILWLPKMDHFFCFRC